MEGTITITVAFAGVFTASLTTTDRWFALAVIALAMIIGAITYYFATKSNGKKET